MRKSGRSERVKQIQSAQRNLAGQPGSHRFPRDVPAASIRDFTAAIVVPEVTLISLSLVDLTLVETILTETIIFGDAAQRAGVCFKVLYHLGGRSAFIGIAVNP